MDKDKYEKYLLEALYNYYSIFGYTLNKKNEEYKFTNDLSEIRLYQTIVRPDCLYYNFNYYVQNPDIDILVGKTTIATMPSWLSAENFFFASKKEYGSKMSEMVNCDLYNNPPSLEVKNEFQIKDLVSFQQKYFEKVVLPYFDKFQNFESIYNFLSPYLFALTETQLVEDADRALAGYFFPEDYMSLMISCWNVRRPEYPEILRRIKLLFQDMPIIKSYEYLNHILQTEY